MLPQVLFNIIYDSLLGAKLKWHALVPVIDSMNHSSNSRVRCCFHRADRVSTCCSHTIHSCKDVSTLSYLNILSNIGPLPRRVRCPSSTSGTGLSSRLTTLCHSTHRRASESASTCAVR